jgi:O-6-methylguanine DNA methyltransferase
MIQGGDRVRSEAFSHGDHRGIHQAQREVTVGLHQFSHPVKIRGHERHHHHLARPDRPQELRLRPGTLLTLQQVPDLCQHRHGHQQWCWGAPHQLHAPGMITVIDVRGSEQRPGIPDDHRLRRNASHPAPSSELACSRRHPQNPGLAGTHPRQQDPHHPAGTGDAGPASATTSQRRVWNLIAQVPYGSITTYGALAAQLNAGLDAKPVRAAVGRNPLCILIPCHRVISSTGKLTGYAGGLRRKQHLLDLERANTAPHQPSVSDGLW